MDSPNIRSCQQELQRFAAHSGSALFSGCNPSHTLAAGSIHEQSIFTQRPVLSRPLSQFLLTLRICSRLVCVAGLCAIAVSLAGCGGSIISGSNSTLTGTIVAELPVPLDTSTVVKWSTQGATQVEVEGEDIYSTDPAGSHTVSPLHRSVYFLGASNQAEILEKSVVIDVIIPEAQQMSAHAEWEEELPPVLATLQCGNNIAYQEPGQGLQDALAMATHDPSVSCLVLQPVSTTNEVVYYEGLAADTGTTQIRYISDIPDVAFPDTVGPPNGAI